MKYKKGKWVSSYQPQEHVVWHKTYCPKPIQCEVVGAKVTKNGQGSERVHVLIREDCIDERSGIVFAKAGIKKWVDGVNISRISPNKGLQLTARGAA